MDDWAYYSYLSTLSNYYQYTFSRPIHDAFADSNKTAQSNLETGCVALSSAHPIHHPKRHFHQFSRLSEFTVVTNVTGKTKTKLDR